ncbi:E2F-associated phosphoprotein [Anguilla anguilla]|uniref:E2F-associated phosphoprotein n=1 Tax=Anguilla anguilla TaxID=7936 RepID=UPI0015B25856|nr:E2F-associated phosphoprotein [Anguilla anguilla]
MNRKEDYDSYEIEEPSDEERAESSSEDELDVLLHGTPDQKRKLLREYLTGESESSSGDEFEKEMEAELSSTMKTMECKWSTPASSEGTSGTTDRTAATSGNVQPQQYDDIYFDTDSDEDETPGNAEGRRRKQRRIPTNDELLYDPDEDDRDQAWVDAKRREYRSRKKLPGSANRREKTEALPSSDAVLNCPACMTTLCLDCQRHEKFRTQYRAMFVMNCRVNKEEVLRYKTPADRKRMRRRKKMKSSPQAQPVALEPGVVEAEPEETYYPVQCTECSTEVAVFDKDEVYHFFNILASHS